MNPSATASKAGSAASGPPAAGLMTRITVFHPCYALIAASALLLAGCGATSGQSGQLAHAGPASSSLNDVPTSTTATPCGTVPSVPGAQANVRAGTVDCYQATRVITQYLPGAFAE